MRALRGESAHFKYAKTLFSRHARKHFSQAEGSQLDEVRQVMGMLAFPPDTHISPYKVMSTS